MKTKFIKFENISIIILTIIALIFMNLSELLENSLYTKLSITTYLTIIFNVSLNSLFNNKKNKEIYILTGLILFYIANFFMYKGMDDVEYRIKFIFEIILIFLIYYYSKIRDNIEISNITFKILIYNLYIILTIMIVIILYFGIIVNIIPLDMLLEKVDNIIISIITIIVVTNIILFQNDEKIYYNRQIIVILNLFYKLLLPLIILGIIFGIKTSYIIMYIYCTIIYTIYKGKNFYLDIALIINVYTLAKLIKYINEYNIIVISLLLISLIILILQRIKKIKNENVFLIIIVGITIMNYIPYINIYNISKSLLT